MRGFICVSMVAIAMAVSVPAVAGNISVTDMSSQVRIDGPGVDVRIGERHRYRDRHWDNRRYWHARCRTVTVRERGPYGEVIIRRHREC